MALRDRNYQGIAHGSRCPLRRRPSYKGGPTRREARAALVRVTGCAPLTSRSAGARRHPGTWLIDSLAMTVPRGDGDAAIAEPGARRSARLVRCAFGSAMMPAGRRGAVGERCLPLYNCRCCMATPIAPAGSAPRTIPFFLGAGHLVRPDASVRRRR
jgi:hypothetical protein